MSHDLSTLLKFLAALLILIACIVFFQYLFWTGGLKKNELAEITQFVSEGDFAAAIAKNQSVQSDPNKTVDEKARAAYATVGAQYRLTADIGARFADIRELKRIVLDERLAVQTRVNALNVLANQYSISGRETEVFDEIYKDPPFNTHLVPNDPDLSARHLSEWSYEMLPSSAAAIAIARWYSEQYGINPGQGEEKTKEYADRAEDYLKKADMASLSEARDETFTSSPRYVAFRYWRAVVVGRLAVQKGEPYLSEYKDEYASFIALAEQQTNVFAKEYLLYARLFYAQRLVDDNDVAGAALQLDTLANELVGISDKEASVFIRFLKNEYTNHPDGVTWAGVKKMFVVSPDFQRQVENIVVK